MKIFWISACILFIGVSCKNNEQNATLAQQQKEIDSLNAVIARNQKAEEKTAEPNKEPIKEESKPSPTQEHNLIRPGKHSLTLQWISWDDPGSVDIKKIGDNKYSVKGGQNGKGKDYLKIDGILEPINERELKFSGLVEHAISHIGEGKVCKKEGNFIFKATGTRKYWRMQNMSGCYDGVTDYVDIYF